MSTRSLTIFKDDDGKEIAVMYHHYDGYLAGYGKELAEFLEGMVLTCGIPYPLPRGKFANGMGCLAAQVVAHFKNNEVGNVYLYAAGRRDIGEEYIYEVTGKEREEVTITAMKGYGNNDVLVSGKASEVLRHINSLT